MATLHPFRFVALASLGAAVLAVAVASRAEAPDTLSMSDVSRVVAASRAEARRCYDAGLARNPSLAGKVVVEFTILADGRVSGAKKSESSLSDAAVDACIVRVVSQLRFPASSAVTSTVRVPYAFVAASPSDAGSDAGKRMDSGTGG